MLDGHENVGPVRVGDLQGVHRSTWSSKDNAYSSFPTSVRAQLRSFRYPEECLFVETILMNVYDRLSYIAWQGRTDSCYNTREVRITVKIVSC